MDDLPRPLPLSVHAVTDGDAAVLARSQGRSGFIIVGSRTSSCSPLPLLEICLGRLLHLEKCLFCSLLGGGLRRLNPVLEVH